MKNVSKLNLKAAKSIQNRTDLKTVVSSSQCEVFCTKRPRLSNKLGIKIFVVSASEDVKFDEKFLARVRLEYIPSCQISKVLARSSFHLIPSK
jgi:hypothetical protein